MINIDAHDLSKGKPHLVLGLLWQIIRIGLFNQITLEHCPGLVQLLGEDEEMADLMRLAPEAILLRWVNYHLERAGANRRINNFTSDIKDSVAYTHLMKQIAPATSGVSTEALHEHDHEARAELMLQQADKLGCRSFLTPCDVVEGVYKLNVAFVANLFNNHPGLDKPEEPLELENIEETREEKTYRNWCVSSSIHFKSDSNFLSSVSPSVLSFRMNSLGVSPYVNWLYSDLADGLVIFQVRSTNKRREKERAKTRNNRQMRKERAPVGPCRAIRHSFPPSLGLTLSRPSSFLTQPDLHPPSRLAVL